MAVALARSCCALSRSSRIACRRSLIDRAFSRRYSLPLGHAFQQSRQFDHQLQHAFSIGARDRQGPLQDGRLRPTRAGSSV